jgi:hypothetical protein
VQHFGREEHVLQGIVIIFINIIIFTRILRGFFIAGFCATIEEVLLAIKVDRISPPMGISGLSWTVCRGKRLVVGASWALLVLPTLSPNSGHPPSSYHSCSSSSSSRLGLRLRRAPCLLDSSSISVAMRALRLRGAASSIATCKSLPPTLYGFHCIHAY